MLEGVHFQTDGFMSNSTYIKYLGTLPELQQLTFCFRMFVEMTRNSPTIFSYATTATHESRVSDDEILFSK